MRQKMPSSCRWWTRLSPPERKSGPHRLTIILVAALVAFLLSCAGVLVAESLRRRQEQDSQLRARLALLRHYLRFS